MKYRPLLLSPLGLIPMGVQPVPAADMPVKVQPAVTYTPTWSGFYVGANLGMISDHSSQNAFLPSSPGGGGIAYCWLDNCNFTNSQTAVGVLGGLQIGYNFQSGNIVFGVETDFDLSSARKEVTVTSARAAIGTATSKTGVEALGTARLRLGYAFDRALIFATGGLAYAKMVNTFQGGSTGYSWSDTGWRTGYTVGGGLEYMFDRNWSIKGEALYYKLGSKDHTSTGAPFGVVSVVGLSDRMNGYVARVGINYLFH